MSPSKRLPWPRRGIALRRVVIAPGRRRRRRRRRTPVVGHGRAVAHGLPAVRVAVPGLARHRLAVRGRVEGVLGHVGGRAERVASAHGIGERVAAPVVGRLGRVRPAAWVTAIQTEIRLPNTLLIILNCVPSFLVYKAYSFSIFLSLPQH